MALKSGSLGTLLQGVSQQPDRVRLDGQVSEQINMISDVTLGLSTRPATNNGPTLANGTKDYVYSDITVAGEDYVLGYCENSLRVWDINGNELEIVDNTYFDYVGCNMQFHVVDGKVVVLNRDTVTEQSSFVEPRSHTGYGIYHCLGGQFSKTYSVTLTFSNGYSQTSSYTTPDGTNTGDAEKTSAEHIVRVITRQFNDSGALPSGTVGGASASGDTARYIHPTLGITVTTSDGENGEILRGMSDTVTDVTRLPRHAPNGYIVRVSTSEASEDDFWLKFKTNSDNPENGTSGFGEEGVWIEWRDPSEPRDFNLSTMPHVLSIDNAGSTFTPGEWLGRSVGDESSAPFPSFIGKRIRDVGGFEGRIVLLGENSVVMSRTNEPFDLFRESATVVSATDPVDITSTKQDDLRLDWLVPFDRDMFVMADPGSSQFVIRGGGLSPETISMVLTTEFEISSNNSTPVSTGRTILFPFSSGAFSGIKEFYTDSDNAANAANTLTETQDRFIKGAVRHIAVSQNFNTALMLADDLKTVYVYKYLWDGKEPLQSAWSYWTFVDEVRHLFFRDSEVTLVSSDVNGKVFLHTLDLNRPVGAFGYHEMLDRRVQVNVSDEFIDLPFANAKFLQYFGCETPGLETKAVRSIRLNSETVRYFMDSREVPVGSQVAAGQEVPWYLTPTQVFGKDYQNRVDTSLKVTVQDYVVHLYNSGEFKAIGKSPYSPDWEYFAQVFPMDNEPLDPDRLILQTGPYYIPWGERADWSTITLHGTDIRPVTIHEVEWIGQILRTKGRRA